MVADGDDDDDDDDDDDEDNGMGDGDGDMKTMMTMVATMANAIMCASPTATVAEGSPQGIPQPLWPMETHHVAEGEGSMSLSDPFLPILRVAAPCILMKA